MTDDLKLNPAGFAAYFRAKGTEEWIDLGLVSRAEPVDGPFEVRRHLPATKILSRSAGVEVDVTDDFYLELGITLTVAFPTLEEARKWCGKEDA